MEDIYKIQVSVGLNESIFAKLKELTGALNKADASVVRLTKSLRQLSTGMKATGMGAVESAASVLKKGIESLIVMLDIGMNGDAESLPTKKTIRAYLHHLEREVGILRRDIKKIKVFSSS